MAGAREVTAYFSGNQIIGEKLEDAIGKAKDIWNHVCEKGNIEHIFLRNPYDSKDERVTRTENKEDFLNLLDHVQEQGRIPYQDTYWVYCVSGIVNFDTGEQIQVSLRPSSLLTYIDAIRPQFANPAKVKGWVYHYTPPVENFEAALDVPTLVEQTKH